MITLKTGVPGSFKTHSTVSELIALDKQWTASPEKRRKLYTHNIPELKVPHEPLPLIEMIDAKTKETYYVPDWEKVEDGSLVVADEAQSLFQVRPGLEKMPKHVAFLNTHRHHGLDIVFITQHPKLIDMAIRRLVGKHQHYRRIFGWKKAIVYEWDHCDDGLSGLKTAVTSTYMPSSKTNEVYKSAEIHTKPKYKIPVVAYVPFVLIPALFFIVPSAYSTITNVFSGKGLTSKTVTTSGKTPEVVAATTPATPEKKAPEAVKTVEPSIEEKPKREFAGCIVAPPKGCKCYDDDGNPVKTDACNVEVAAARVGPNPLDRLNAPDINAHMQTALQAEVDENVLSFVKKQRENRRDLVSHPQGDSVGGMGGRQPTMSSPRPQTASSGALS